MSVAVQSLSASAQVGDFNLRLKDAKIERGTGFTIGKVTVKGIVVDGDPNSLSAGDQVTVNVVGESVENPFLDTTDSSARVFTGELYSAKQDEEGVLKVEAFDAFNELQKKSVQLNTSTQRTPRSVIDDLLGELFDSTTSDLSNASPSTPYVSNENYSGSNSPSQWTFGNAEQGEPLIGVLMELLDTLGGKIWCDTNGIIRVENSPPTTEWETPLATEIEAGEEAAETNRVIVNSSGIDSELGQGSAYVSTQISHQSSTGIGSQFGILGPEETDKKINAQNVTDFDEADQQSLNAAAREDQRRDLGKITFIGNAEIDLYDHMYIPEIDYIDNNVNDLRDDPLYSEVFYKVDEIEHKINGTDGFLTTVKISPDPKETYENVKGVSSDLKQSYLSAESNSIQDQKLSGGEDSTGFLGGLFGGFL